MTKIQNPEFLKYAAPDSILSAKDVMKIFGYASYSTFYRHVKQGDFPSPDKRRLRHGKTSVLVWNAKTIMNEIKRRNMMEATA